MAVEIDATVGGESANSYVSAADADAYFADTLREPTWTGHSPGERARALIQTTQQLEREKLHGDKYDDDQALHFPRETDYDNDAETTEIPDEITYAICEQAFWLLEQEENPDVVDRQSLQAQGVTSISLDGLSESYSGQYADGWSPQAKTHLKRYVSRTARIQPRGDR